MDLTVASLITVHLDVNMAFGLVNFIGNWNLRILILAMTWGLLFGHIGERRRFAVARRWQQIQRYADRLKNKVIKCKGCKQVIEEPICWSHRHSPATRNGPPDYYHNKCKAEIGY